MNETIMQTDVNHGVDGQQAQPHTRHPLLKRLATRAMGMTGADIERIVREARLRARRERRQVSYEDIEAGIRSHRPPPSPERRWRVAVHETGHVLVHHALALGPIGGVTIDSANGAFGRLGFESSRADSRAWIEDVLATLLAGRAAEALVLGEATAGAGGMAESDLARATTFAFSLERTLGFGADLPLLYRPANNETSVLDGDRMLATRVHAHLERAQERATGIIKANRPAFDAVANALAGAQALEGSEVVAMLESAGATSQLPRP